MTDTRLYIAGGNSFRPIWLYVEVLIGTYEVRLRCRVKKLYIVVGTFIKYSALKTMENDRRLGGPRL